MTEVRFYHLQKQSLDQALPLILEKAYGAGHKSVVKMENNAEVEEMLNGHSDAQISTARARWKIYQELGYETTYWFQGENGGWSKKA